MSELLGALYHWAPTARRRRIIRSGLVPLQVPVTSTGEDSFRQPHVCLSPTPSMAWSLSGGMRFDRLDQYPEWDLWQVRLTNDDSVQIRAMFGNKIEEVQVCNRIPKSRLWFVATRERPPTA